MTKHFEIDKMELNERRFFIVHILDELHLADVELRKSFITRIVGFLLVSIFLVAAQMFLFWYISDQITLDSQPTKYSIYTLHNGYYEKEDDGQYTCYFYDGGWKRFENVSENHMNNIKLQYNNSNNAEALIEGTPNSSDIGLITWIHKLIITVIIGGGLGLVLEPLFRRGQNRRQVLVFCEMYNVEENNEMFDESILETIKGYQNLCKEKNLTEDQKMSKLFLSERLVNPDKAKRREKHFAVKAAKAKLRAEQKALEESKLIQEERIAKEKAEKAAKAKAEAQARAKREKNRQDHIKRQYEAELKRLDEVMLVATNDNIPEITADMTEEEVAKIKELQKQEAVRVSEKRQLIRHMRKQSSFMK